MRIARINHLFMMLKSALLIIALLLCGACASGGRLDLYDTVITRETGVGQFRWSPDSRRIVFTYRTGRDSQLVYLADSSGKELSLLSARPGVYFDPCFSSDGSRVFFVEDLGRKKTRIVTKRLDDPSVPEFFLTQGDSFDLAPNASSQTDEIVFASSTNGRNANVYVINSDGTELRRITEGRNHDTNPLFVPNADTILFRRAHWFGHYSPIAARQWHHWTVMRIDSDGSNLVEIAGDTSKNYRLDTLSVSSDGTRIAFNIEGYYEENVYVAQNEPNAEAVPLHPQGEPYMVRDEDGSFISARHSSEFVPGTNELAFLMADPPQKWDFVNPIEIHLVNLSTRVARAITRNSSQHREGLQVSPDGARILYRVDTRPSRSDSFRELWVVDIDGTGDATILDKNSL